MENNETMDFELLVSVTDATDEELDTTTRRLLSELLDLDIESAELTSAGPAPLGSKGDPVTLGSIAVVVLPAAVPSLIALVQAWMLRGSGRIVKFKGKGIEFEGSAEELQKVLASLQKQKKKTK